MIHAIMFRPSLAQETNKTRSTAICRKGLDVANFTFAVDIHPLIQRWRQVLDEGGGVAGGEAQYQPLITPFQMQRSIATVRFG